MSKQLQIPFRFFPYIFTPNLNLFKYQNIKNFHFLQFQGLILIISGVIFTDITEKLKFLIFYYFIIFLHFFLIYQFFKDIFYILMTASRQMLALLLLLMHNMPNKQEKVVYCLELYSILIYQNPDYKSIIQKYDLLYKPIIMSSIKGTGYTSLIVLSFNA